MSRRSAAVLLALAGLALRAGEAPPRELTVFAAASLTEAFQELGRRFEAAQPGVRVVFSFGASNQLRAQIENGARADVFASANTKEMDAALKSGSVVKDSVQVFARNRLVLAAPADNPARIVSLASLARPRIKLVVADPAAPAGKYTLEMLKAAAAGPGMPVNFESAVLANVASREENVKAVLAKVRLGEADAGIVYASDITAAARKQVRVIALPPAANPLAAYPLAVVKEARQPELARAFAALAAGAEGQRVLQGAGFLPAGEAPPLPEKR
jgi:molybdate transport system substrate-binding protein